MDSTEFNKIAGAGLAALLVFLLLNFFAGKVFGTGEFHGEEHVLAYALPVEATGAAEVEAPQVDLVALFSNPDLAVGEKDFRACTACHSLNAGENKVGPSLHGVVGRAVASVEGFKYSDAMAAHGGTWTPEELFHFLGDPKGQVPGTKMTYAGVKDPQERADVIAYLNQHGDAPIDLTAGLPAAEANAGAAEGATDGAAEGEAAPDQEAPATGTEAAPAEPQPDADTQGAAEPAEQTAAAPAEQTAPAAAEPAEQAAAPAEPAEQAAAPAEPAEQATAPVEQAPAPAEPAEQAAAPTEPAGQAAAPAEPAEQAAAPAEPAGQAAGTAAGAAGAAAAGLDFAQADAAAGEKLFRRCAACHKVEEGKNGVGPSLWGVVGRPVGTVEGFSYSPAMKEHGGDWTPENLAAYIENPKGVVPGTKMVFAGLKKAQDRIDLIAYLNQHAANPQPLQ